MKIFICNIIKQMFDIRLVQKLLLFFTIFVPKFDEQVLNG